MKTYEKRERTYEAQEVTAITCDHCGKDLARDNGSYLQLSEGASFYIGFGFGSRHDLAQWDFDVCDDCAAAVRDFIRVEASAA